MQDQWLSDRFLKIRVVKGVLKYSRCYTKFLFAGISIKENNAIHETLGWGPGYGFRCRFQKIY